MSNANETRDYGRFDELAEEFAERYRRGERPSLQEYVDRLPQMADEIREMFPALVEVERAEGDAREATKLPAPTAAPRLREVGDYRIVREIGRGGMGVVYEAEQISLGRRVALKVLPSHVVGDRKTQQRFLREAKSAARLHHTNIVPVFEVGRDREVSFYAMQLIQGQGLDQVIDELRRLRQHSLRGHVTGAAGLGSHDLAATKTQTHARVTATSLLQKRELGQMAELLMTGGFALETKRSQADGMQEELGSDVTEAFESGLQSNRTSADVVPGLVPARSVSDSQTSAVLPGGKHVSEVDTSGRRVPFFRSVAQIGRQVAQGLAHAHSRGIIHRDVKPSNLLLDTAGVVWITDFGLAKADDEGLTATGDILGTLRYMAPERFRGMGDGRADIYALGMTLYELLTLRPGFASSDRLKLIEQLKAQEPPKPRSIDNRIPRDLETIDLKAIDKDPERRYASMDALAEDLRRFLVDEPIRARQITRSERIWRWTKRNPYVAGMSASLLGVLLIALILSVQNGNRLATLAGAERAARFESDAARKSAQLAAIETQKIAAQAQSDKELAERESYRSTIKLAGSMLQGDAQAKYGVADILWGVRPELRGWEWGHLMAQCPLEEWSLQTNQGGLEALAASADGRLLVTAGSDGTVALWDSWTRAEMWRQHVGSVLTLDVDPRGNYLGVTSSVEIAPAFRILDIATGQEVWRSEDNGRARLAFSPEGNVAYVLRPDTLERFTTRDWSLVASVSKPKAEPWESLRLFVDGAGHYVGVHAIRGDERVRSMLDRRIALFDAETLRPVVRFDAILPTRATNLASAAEPWLHTGFDELIVSDGPLVYSRRLVTEPGSEGRLRQLIEHPTTVDYCAYDRRSGAVVAASIEGTVTLRDAGGEVRNLYHGLSMRGLELLRDGRLITAGSDGLLKCWPPARSASLTVNADASPSGASDGLLAFADDGQLLLYRTWERPVHYLYDVNTLAHRLYAAPTGGDYGVRFPLIQPGTQQIVADGNEGLAFYSLRPTTTSKSKISSVELTNPFSAAFDASGRVLVISGHDQRVAAFDTKSQRRFPETEARGFGVVSVNAAGTRAALVTGTSLQVWDIATGRMLNRTDWDASWAGPPNEHGDRLTRDESRYVSLVNAQFHPNMDLLAFIKDQEQSSSLLLCDTGDGAVHRTIEGPAGIRFTWCAFSPDGNRLLIACSDSKVRLYDWRIGKDLYALADAAHTVHVAASPDGVTIAYSGWAPSLRVAKALPWHKEAQRDGVFYGALDDLWTYSIQLSPEVKPNGESAKARQTIRADEAEILGDIARRREDVAANAGQHYAKATEIRQTSVLGDPQSERLQGQLATAYEKYLAVEIAHSAERGEAVLQHAAEFWQKLVANGNPKQVTWRYALDFQLRHLDLQLARAGSDAKALLLPQIELWCEYSDKGPNGPSERVLRYGLTEMWTRLVRGVPGFMEDGQVIDTLVERHPQLVVTVGDQYASDKNWERALAIYGHAISAHSGFDHVRRMLALADADAANDQWPLDSAKKLALRRRALDALTAELGRLSDRLGAEPNQDAQAIVETLLFWQNDVDVARVREPEAIARLTAEEQRAWEALWADVDSLAKRLPAAQIASLNPVERDANALAELHQRGHQLAATNPKLAEPLFREVLRGYRELEGPDAELTIDLTLDLASVFIETGRSAEAEPLLRQALDQIGPDHRFTMPVLVELGLCLAVQDKWNEAEPMLRKAIESARDQFGADDPQTGALLAALGTDLLEAKKWLEAEPYLRESVAIREKSQPDEWGTFNSRSLLGGSLSGQKKFVEAEPLIISGYEGLKARESKIPLQAKPRLNEAAKRVIKLYEDWNKLDQAAEWRVKLTP